MPNVVISVSLPDRFRAPLQGFLERTIARDDVRGIALAGSWASGRGGPRSDLDLMIITTGDLFVRKAEWVEELEIQVMEGPLTWYHLAFTERKVGTVQRMIANCVALWDPDGLVSHLQLEARQEVARGPDPADEVGIRRARFRVTEALDDLEDLARSSEPDWAAIGVVKAELVQCLFDAFWLTRRCWPEKAKYALEALRAIEPAVAESMATVTGSIRGTGEEQPEAEMRTAVTRLLLHEATEAARAVLSPVGGLLRESWSSPPEIVQEWPC